MPSLLIVLTGADSWTLRDGTQHPTGFWAEELLEPLEVFDGAGLDVTFATPGGVRPTVDEGSLNPQMVGGEDNAASLRSRLDGLQERLSSAARLEDVSPGDYDAVFVPGGHGPMEDLAVSEHMGRLLATMLEQGRVVGSVCHGPAALLPAQSSDGSWAFAGRELTGFTNEEETQAGLAEQAPWLLEDRLREAGATVRTGDAWASFVVVDDNLVTGQNPASSTEAAQRVVGLLQDRAA
jgi:putative intracellular protease/amidase